MYKTSRKDGKGQRELGLFVMNIDEVVYEYECEDKVRCDLEKNKIDLHYGEYNQATALLKLLT
jgi:hypothetical protein